MSRLTMAQFEALRAIDSPTVANAIERFEIRPRTEGYAGYDLRCQFPALGHDDGLRRHLHGGQHHRRPPESRAA